MRHGKRTLGTLALVAFGVLLVALFGKSQVTRFRDARGLGDRGFIPRVFIDDDGISHHYVVFVPHHSVPVEGKGYPVILFLNGFGENGEDGFNQVANILGRPIWEIQETFPFLAVAPQCSVDGSWTKDPDASIAMEILDAALEDYPCDRDRIYLMGASSGGSGVLEFIQHHAQRFAAAVPVQSASCISGPEATARVVKENRLPIWAFYNVGDSDAIVKLHQNLHKAFQRIGCDYRVTGYDRLGHNAGAYAFRDPALYRWMLSKSRASDTAATWQAFQAAAVDEGEVPSSGIRFRFLPDEDFEIVFESQLTQPIDLVLRAPASRETQPPHRVRLESPRRNVMDQPARRQRVNPVGAFAIRPGQVNTVVLRRHGRSFEASVNGWPIWDPLLNVAALSELVIQPFQNDGDRVWNSLRNVRSRFRPAALLGVEVMPADEPDLIADGLVSEEPDMASTIALLTQRSVSAVGHRLSWTKHPIGELVSSHPSPAFTSSVEVTREVTTFASHRVDTDPSRMSMGRGLGQPAVPLLVRPSMLRTPFGPSDFSTAIAAEFAVEQPFPALVKEFRRSLSSQGSVDVLRGHPGGFSKVLRRRRLLMDPASWARLAPEADAADQLDSLHHAAALLALGRIGHEPFHVDFDRLRHLGWDHGFSGHQCQVLEEVHPEDDRFRRRFWVDLDRDGLILRFVGKVLVSDELLRIRYRRPPPATCGDVCIDLEYDQETGTVQSWTVINGRTTESPLRSVSGGNVVATASNTSVKGRMETEAALAENRWVIDQQAGRQYLVVASSEQRVLTDFDVAARLTFDQLIGTRSAKDELRTITMTRIQQGLTLLGAVLLCLGGHVLFRRRRQHQTSFSSSPR